jgi:peptide/nickel transport system substrate-binding protein
VRYAIILVAAAACVRGGDGGQKKQAAGPKAYAGDTLPPVQAQGEPIAGGVLRVGMDAEPPTLNFQLDPLDGWAKAIDELIYEPLARPNPKTWEHEPRLAERWEISPDQLTFTFHLKQGVRWHDGKPLTADDVVWTFKKLLDPTSKTMAVRSFLEPVQDVIGVDAHTVRFSLKRRYWYAFDAIAEINIYPKHVYAGGDFNTHPANREPTVGNGRFKFVHWKTGDEIALERNNDYFGEPARLERIVFKYAPDPTVRVQLLRRGELDVVLRISPDVWRNVSDDPDVAQSFWRLRHVPNGLQWIGWNEGRAPFGDPQIRRAMTMLLDRDDVVQNLRLGLDAPAVSWFYPGSKEHDPHIRAWPYDVEGAKKILERAGWIDHDADGVLDKDGKPFEFTFVYPAGNPFYEQLASLMIAEYKKAGITMQTSRLEWAVFTERVRRHEFDACSLLWQLYPRGDPYQIWHSGEAAGGSNFINFRNAEVDRILVQAREEFDEAKRMALYHRFSEILHEEEPYTMLFYRYNLSLVSKKFGGVYSTPYGLLRLDEFYMRKDPETIGSAQ